MESNADLMLKKQHLRALNGGSRQQNENASSCWRSSRTLNVMRMSTWLGQLHHRKPFGGASFQLWFVESTATYENLDAQLEKTIENGRVSAAVA